MRIFMIIKIFSFFIKRSPTTYVKPFGKLSGMWCVNIIFVSVYSRRTSVGEHDFGAIRSEPKYNPGTGIRSRHGMRTKKIPRIILAIFPVQPGQAYMYARHGRAWPTPVACY